MVSYVKHNALKVQIARKKEKTEQDDNKEAVNSRLRSSDGSNNDQAECLNQASMTSASLTGLALIMLCDTDER